MTLALSARYRASLNRPRLNVHRGFSLIELMVSILITMFLIAGVIGIVFSVRGSFRTQDGLSQIQETQRFSLTVLNTTIRQAGYFLNPMVDSVTNVFSETATPNPDGTLFVAGQYVSGTGNASTGSANTVNVRYQAGSNDGLMNCQGDLNTSGASLVWTNSFAVNGSNQLTCTVSVNGGTPGTAAILSDNVGRIVALYGVDTDADGNIDTYMYGNAVTAGGYWRAVGSVQLLITYVDLVNSTATNKVMLPRPLVHTINLMNQG